MKIILASKSPRRKEILGQIGIDFEVIVSEAEEPAFAGGDVEEYVKRLSLVKAEAVAQKIKMDIEKPIEDNIIIGADTIVVKDGVIFGKPKDKEDARRMIGVLSGATHYVLTGVSIIKLSAESEEIVSSFAEKTSVHVKAMSEAETESYISSEEPYDKAGAYGIQGIFSKYISGIEGDYLNVVGLPASRLYDELKTIL